MNAYRGVAEAEVQDEAEIVWSAPADAAEADDEPAARKKRCACVKDDGQRCRELVLGADDWDASMGDWDPERYCSQECALAEERRAARILAERAPAPAPSTKPKRPLQRSHDGGLAGMIAACAKAPEEAAAEETSEDEDEDESSVDDDEAPPAPAPGRVVGRVRKWDGHKGWIRVEGAQRQKDAPDGRGNQEAFLERKQVRGGVALRDGDRVEFTLTKAARFKNFTAVDVAPAAAAAAAAAPARASGDAFVDALYAYIVGQGKTRIEGGALSLFWEAHPSVPRPKLRFKAHIKAHGGGLLRYVEDQGGATTSRSSGRGRRGRSRGRPSAGPRGPPRGRSRGRRGPPGPSRG